MGNERTTMGQIIRHKEQIMRAVDEYTFKKVKGNIFWKLTPGQAAAKYDLSLGTVLKIRGSHDYGQFKELVKATHPEIQYSLKDNVLELHKIVFDKKDNKYIAPATARKAILELQLKFIKENK